MLKKKLYYTNKNNQSKLVALLQIFWNLLWRNELKAGSLKSSKNHQVNTSFILLLRWIETFCCYQTTRYSMIWWIAMLKLKKIIHKTKSEYIFYGLNISGNNRPIEKFKKKNPIHKKSTLKLKLRERWYYQMFKVQDQLNQDTRIIQ